jgi:hypothetical protein
VNQIVFGAAHVPGPAEWTGDAPQQNGTWRYPYNKVNVGPQDGSGGIAPVPNCLFGWRDENYLTQERNVYTYRLWPAYTAAGDLVWLTVRHEVYTSLHYVQTVSYAAYHVDVVNNVFQSPVVEGTDSYSWTLDNDEWQRWTLSLGGHGRPSFGGGHRSGGRGFGNGGGGNRFGGGNRGGGNRGGGRGFQGANIDIARFINKTNAIVEEKAVEYVIEHQFTDFKIEESLKQNIIKKGYTTPTPIQDRTIPHALLGQDVIGIANTGTGKTAAFLIPLINKVLLNPNENILIVVPTRELATQIEDEFRGFARGLNMGAAVCVGGASIGRQFDMLRRGPQFVIGTPGRRTT